MRCRIATIQSILLNTFINVLCVFLHTIFLKCFILLYCGTDNIKSDHRCLLDFNSVVNKKCIMYRLFDILNTKAKYYFHILPILKLKYDGDCLREVGVYDLIVFVTKVINFS